MALTDDKGTILLAISNASPLLNPEMREFAAHFLEKAGYRVQLARLDKESFTDIPYAAEMLKNPETLVGLGKIDAVIIDDPTLPLTVAAVNYARRLKSQPDAPVTAQAIGPSPAGTDLIRQIRNNPKLKDVLVHVTGIFPDREAQFMKAGADSTGERITEARQCEALSRSIEEKHVALGAARQ